VSFETDLAGICGTRLSAQIEESPGEEEFLDWDIFSTQPFFLVGLSSDGNDVSSLTARLIFHGTS